MKARSITASAVVLAMCALVAAPVLAQTVVSVQNPTFAWTGKAGQTANYHWTASVDNPSKKELNVRVTIELLDGAGNVVGSDTSETWIGKMARADIDQTASVAFAEAEKASQYRVVLTEIEK
jgi:hypothetical protein